MEGGIDNVKNEDFPSNNSSSSKDKANKELLEKFNFEKKHSEILRQHLNKCQDERREIELKLVAEKALRDQETKNTTTLLEKKEMEFNAQLYSMKCEVETFKQKADAKNQETQLLKEQLKIVELEKWEISQKLTQVEEESNAYTSFRKSFDIYTKRVKDAIEDLSKQLNQCRYAQDEMSDLLEAYKREVAVYNVHIKSFHSQQIENSWEQKVMELEQGLLNAERIKEMLLDKITSLEVRHSELYAKNLQSLNNNKQLNDRIIELNHHRVIGRNISKEQWENVMKQLDSGKTHLEKIAIKAEKIMEKGNNNKP